MRKSQIKRALLNNKRQGKFRPNGQEGQMTVRRNKKGEIELVAFFGGKWYYCPMAEIGKDLSLKPGVKIGRDHIMSSTQKKSTGFNQVRLNPTSSELVPKNNEAIIYVDTVPATTAAAVSCDTTADRTVTTNNTNGDANIKVGLNISGTRIPDGAWITAINSSGSVGPKSFEISEAATGNGTAVAMQISTRDVGYPNVFFNILFKDGAQTELYYHKFQLNVNTLANLRGAVAQDAKAGQTSGSGGTGRGGISS